MTRRGVGWMLGRYVLGPLLLLAILAAVILVIVLLMRGILSILGVA